MPSRRGGGSCVWVPAAALVLLLAGAVLAPAQARLIRFADVQPVLTALATATPAVLQGVAASEPAWATWIATRDREIRARLAQGDEDTLINWLLLGTSFTAQPPVLLDATAAADEQALKRMAALIGGRLRDLLAAAAVPGSDERRLFARELLTARGVDLAAARGADAASAYLLNGVGRIIDEWTRLQRERVPQFVDRGLSLDTSLQPNYAVHQTLARLAADGTVAAGSVRRVGIVGAGLDFADKNTGFDFYPVQSVQPFALLDSLRRLGLAADPATTEVVALDISPRVVSHLQRAAAAGAQGRPYTIHLPLDSARAWRPELKQYWEMFGAAIGTDTTPRRPQGSPAVDVRAINVTPAAAARVSALDANVITERREDQVFDLLVATNVFIYYGPLEQALAMSNLAAMLSERGVFLTNNVLPDAAGLPLRRAGSLSVVYATDGTGDRIDWYRK